MDRGGRASGRQRQAEGPRELWSERGRRVIWESGIRSRGPAPVKRERIRRVGGDEGK